MMMGSRPSGRWFTWDTAKERKAIGTKTEYGQDTVKARGIDR